MISSINYTKIIMSVGMIAFVAALVIGATGAFFSDTETSTGNVFAAGAIDLKIDNSSYGFDWNRPGVTDPTGEWGPNDANSWQLTDLDGELFFNFIDLKPGDYGEDTISIHVDNNDAYACVAFDLTGTPENGQNEPEAEVDATAGADEGELQNYLSFLFWHDDGDNVLEEGEELIEGLNGLSGDIFNGGWLPIAESGDDPLLGASTNYIAKGWCFGDISPAPVTPGDYGGPTEDVTGFTCTGAEGDHNDAQTDGITVDVSFYAVQARNNENFSCATLPPLDGSVPPSDRDVTITTEDLSVSIDDVLAEPTSWLFYNDTTDTVMTIDEFAGTDGANDIVTFAGSNGAAYMKLHTDPADPRYNIATYQFSATPLASIGTLKYRIYDASVSSQTPFLHFNVDFDNSDTWQRRLVQVPTGVVANTWTEVDALAGMWNLSGGNWPVGVNTAVPFSGATLRTWADILADYPTAALRTTDSFFGVRVGHPGPIGEEGYVDWVEFDGIKYDFQN